MASEMPATDQMDAASAALIASMIQREVDAWGNDYSEDEMGDYGEEDGVYEEDKDEAAEYDVEDLNGEEHQGDPEDGKEHGLALTGAGGRTEPELAESQPIPAGPNDVDEANGGEDGNSDHDATPRLDKGKGRAMDDVPVASPSAQQPPSSAPPLKANEVRSRIELQSDLLGRTIDQSASSSSQKQSSMTTERSRLIGILEALKSRLNPEIYGSHRVRSAGYILKEESDSEKILRELYEFEAGGGIISATIWMPGEREHVWRNRGRGIPEPPVPVAEIRVERHETLDSILEGFTGLSYEELVVVATEHSGKGRWLDGRRQTL